MIRSYPARLLRSRRTRLVAAASAGVIAWSVASAAAALPTGGVVYDSTGGGATITPGSGTLTVDQAADRVVIDWSTFNIASGETVTFNQPDAGAIAFNRVDPTQFSTIDGTLAANGGVWLFSPGGLLFGSSAVVNVGSFVGSTARLTDADVAGALGTNAVTLSPLAVANGADLTVSAGASIDAATGFVVLLGETVVQNGTVVSDTDAVWFGVAQGGQISFTANPGAGPDLTDGTVAGVADQQPYLIQGPTGTTNAGTWFGVSTPSTTATGWSTLINLGGTIQASGVQPGGPGVVIITGDNGVMDLTVADVHVDTSAGTITSVNDTYIAAPTITLGDVYSDRFVVTNSSGETTVAGTVTSVYGTYINGDGGVTVAATGSLQSDHGIMLFTDAVGADIDIQGTIYADYAVMLFADDQLIVDGTIDSPYGVSLFSLDVSTGASSVVSSTDYVYIQGDDDITLGGTVTAGEIDIQGYDLVTIGGSLNAGDINADSSNGDILVQSGASIVSNGTGSGFTVTMYADGDLTIEDGAIVDSYNNMRLETTVGELTIAGDVYGIYLDLYGAGGATVTDTGSVDGNSIHLGGGGDVVMDGDLYTNNYIGIQSFAGDVLIANDASVEAFSINIIADGTLTTEAGSLIDNTLGVGTISLRAYGADGLGSAMELSGDVDAHNLQLVATTGAITLAAGTITAANDVNVYAQGGDFTTVAGSLIDNDNGRFYVTSTGDITLAGDVNSESVDLTTNGTGSIAQTDGTITVETRFDAHSAGEFNTSAGAAINSAVDYDAVIDVIADGDIHLSGDVTAYDVIFAGHGDLIEVSGRLAGTDRVSIYNDSGDFHLTATGEIYGGQPVANPYSVVYIGASGSILTDAGSYIHTASGYPGAYVNMHSNGPTGTFDLSGDITSANIYVGSRNGDVDVILRDGDLVATEYVFVVSSGDLTTGANSSITTDGNVYLTADYLIDLAGDITGDYVSVITDGDIHQRGGTITVHDGGFYSYSYGDTTTDAGALIQAAAVGADNAIIYLNAGHDLYLAGDIDGSFFVTINSSGIGYDTELEVSGSIYATDWIILYNDYGDIHLTGTADLYVGTPTVFSAPSIYIGAEGSILTDAGSTLGTAAGFAGSYVGIYINDVAGSLDLSGDISSGNVYIRSNFGDVDVIVRDGAITAEGLVTVESTGDVTIMDGASITADYATLQLDGPDGGLIRVDGDITTTETISIYNYVGDVEIGATATLHGNTDASGDNGGPLGFQTDTIEIRGENITADAGSQILVGDLTDTYRGTVSIISDDIDNNLPTTVTLDGYIMAEAIDISVVDGSVAIDGDIFTTGDLAFALTGTFTLGIDGYIYNAGYLHVSADDGIVFDGGAFSYGVELTTTTAGADIDIGGDIYSAFDIDVNSAGDITLGADGTLQSDFLYGSGGAINLTAEGTLYTGLASRIIVGHVGATTGDVVMTANGADGVGVSAIDLNGYIYANGLGLIAPYGSIHLGAGGIYLTEGLDIDAAFDFLMDAGAVIDTPGDVSISAQGDLTANGDIYAGGNVSFYKYATNDGDLTVGGFVHSDGYVRIVNAADGDVILGGDIIADADADTSPGYIYISSQDQVVATGGGLLQVGNGPYNITGGVTINANGVDSVDYSAIDLDVDIIADSLDLNAPYGSIHLAGGDIYIANPLTITSAYDVLIDAPVNIETGSDVTIQADGSLVLNGGLAAGGDVYLTGGDLTVGGLLTGDYLTLESAADLIVSGDIVATYSVSLTSTGGDVYIDGFIEANAYAGTAILVSAEGDLTIAASGDLEGYGDVVLQTTGPDGVLEVSGDVLGYNVYLDAQGGILVGSTADIYAYDRLQLVSDGPVGTIADIQIDGIMDGNGVSIINRNIGDVVFGATADVASYYYYCVSCNVDPGGQTGLLGADGDIYIYSAGSVITVAGSSIDATTGLGADKGLVTIVAAGTDAGGYSAIDLSGDINSYDTYLYAANGSIRQRDGTISVTERFYASAGEDFIQDAAGVIDGLVLGNYANIDIYVGGDIDLAGAISGYYVTIVTDGSAAGVAGVDISGYIYASDEIAFYNYEGGIDLAATAELYVGLPYENTDPAIIIEAEGAVTAAAGSYIHTYAGDAGGTVVVRSNADTGNAIDLAGDIYSGDITINVNGLGTLQITDGTIDALGDIYVSSYGHVQVTGGTMNAAESVFFSSGNDMLLAGAIYAGEVFAHIYSGEASSVPGAVIEVDGRIETDNYIGIYNEVGAVDLSSNAVLSSNNNNTINQGSAAVRIEGLSVTSDAGSLIETPAGNASSQVLIQALDTTGTVVDLQGDIDAGIVTINSFADGGVTIGGDITAQGDIFVHSGAGLTVEDTATFDADDLVALYADRDLLIAGDVYGRYLRAIIDNVTGVDGASIRIEGGLYADRTIELNNAVGDVEIGAGAQVIANLDGLTSQTYQPYDIEIFGEDILTEAGSLITTGADGGPRLGSVLIRSDDASQAPTLVDLSGAIDTDLLQIDIDDGSLRIRDGEIDTIANLFITTTGYITVDDAADIYSQGYFFSLTYGGTTINGDVTADSIIVEDFGGADVVIGGALASRQDITIRSTGDLRISGAAQLISDSDNATGLGESLGIYLEADGQVSTNAGSVIRVGPAGAATGDVNITADGADGGGYAAIDLSGDIEAQNLYLDTAYGSIRLRDGDIIVDGDLDLVAAVDFIMDGPATAYTQGDFNVTAGGIVTVAGAVTALGDIDLANTGANDGAMTINGYLYAGDDVLIRNYGDGDIILGGPTIVADFDGSIPSLNQVYIAAYGGAVVAPGGGEIRVGADGYEHGSVSIYAGGPDGGTTSAIDLSIDITADSLDLTSAVGSIHLRDGDIAVTGDLFLATYVDFLMDAPASIDAGGDVTIVAVNSVVSQGDITSGGDIYLHLDPNLYLYQGFTAGPGDMVVGGNVTANGSIDITNEGSGDIYIDGSAALLADADSTGGPDHISIVSDAQVISASGSTLVVGAVGATTGDVSIIAYGADNGSYSAIDLSGDIDADGLTLDADIGSIHLADGTITVVEDLAIAPAVDFVMDAPAAIDGGGDVSVTAARTLTVDGDIHSDGDIDLLLQGPSSQDLSVGGLLAAAGDIDIYNNGLGDVLMSASTAMFANGLIDVTAGGDIVLDGFIDSATTFNADAGDDLSFDGQIQAGTGATLHSDYDMTLNGVMIVEGYNDFVATAGATLTQTSGASVQAGGYASFQSGFDMVIDGTVEVVGNAIFSSGDDLSTGGVISGANIYLSGDDLNLGGDMTAVQGDVVADAGGYLYQDGSIAALDDVILRSDYDMTVNGDIVALDDIRLDVYGGEGSSNIDIDGDVIADGDVFIVNHSDYGGVYIGANADIVADVDGDTPGAYLDIYAHGYIHTEAGSTIHVGGPGSRTGYITIYTDAGDGNSSAIDLAGDIDAGTIEITAYYGSVEISGGTIAADESITIYAAEFFILEADGVISGGENRAEAFPGAGPGVIYLDYDLPPGVNIAAADVTIDGQITSSDVIAIGAYNVSGGEVTIGGADPISLGTGFTLSNDEFQNLNAESIIFLSGQGEPNGAGYDLHIADLTIDSANVSNVFFGTSEDLYVEGAVTPVGADVNVSLGFGILVTQTDLLQLGQTLVDFVPTNIYISGSLGGVDSPFGSVTLIAEGDILMGSQAFIDAAAADPEFDALDQSGDFDGAESGHIFVASDILQMAAMGRILQQNTGSGQDYAGLAIGLPQPGQELIFVPAFLEGETIGGSGGWLADFSAGPSRIELFGYFVAQSGDVTGFHAAQVDNLLDPSILVGDYYLNSCLFYSNECAFQPEDVPPFQSPFPPVDVQLDFGDTASFFATFPFAEPEDEEDDDEIQGEPVTGSGNEDLWTVKPVGVRP